MVGGRDGMCAERSRCLLISRPAKDGRGSITVTAFHEAGKTLQNVIHTYAVFDITSTYDLFL